MEKLYPQLINEQELVKARIEAQVLNEELVVYETDMEGISTVLMLADEDNLLLSERVLVTQSILDERNLSKEQAYKESLENLKALPFALTPIPTPDNVEGNVYHYMGRDGFESSRILLVDELDVFAEFVSNGGFYGIPTTDMLILFDNPSIKEFGTFVVNESYNSGGIFKLSSQVHDFKK